MDRSGVLRPLTEAAEDIRRLDEYESLEELAAAVTAVMDALERSLRLRLRSDPSAPEEHRLTALSRERLPYDEVVKSLRTRDLISLEAAGTLHEARAAAERAAVQSARAADADVLRQAVHRVRQELGPEEEEAAAVGPPAASTPDASSDESPPAGDSSPYTGRWMAWVAAAFAIAFLVGTAWVVVRGGNREQDEAVRAFRAGRFDSAAVAFERLLEDRPRDVTVMLYLGRSYRRLDRASAAAEVLRRAVEEDPQDAAVRRELGHLFVDLGRLPSAIAQYERALEYGPEDPLSWAALIRALRAAGDPRAEQLLRDAPAEVQASLGGT